MNDNNRENIIKEEKKGNQLDYSITKKIGLFFLIIIFLMMVYFYVSKYFGSISTIFIQNPKFSIQFGVTLFIFTFFSILSGPIYATIAGFLGEFIYQISFYPDIRLEWCIIVALIGLTSSIYKYKPLKYKDGIKVYYTFLTLMLSSIAISFIIMFFQLFLNQEINMESLVIDFGFNYFLKALLSVIFIVPFLILLYDLFLAKKEKYIYSLFLTHHPIYQSDHTFYLKFGRTYVYFCSRCSGAILGGLFSIFFTDILRESIGFTITPELALLLCILLPIPGIIDWGTQRLLYRKSTTESRIITGGIIGIALYFLAFTDKYYFFMLFLVIFYFSLVGIAIYVGQKKALRKAEREENSAQSFKEEQYE